MKRTMVFWSVGLALTLMGGQGFAASTTLNKEGTNVKNFDDINVSISSPNSGFYIKEAAKTAMFSLLAAVGSKNGSKVNTINVGGENTETVFLDGTAQFGTTSNGIEWVSTTAVYAADQNATVNIQAKDSVTIVSNDIGILGQSNTQHGLSDDDDPKRPEESAQINIRSANISIIADNQAVMAFSNSGIELSASDTIYLEGDHAIDTRGNSVINVNTKGRANKVTIVGDVVFETPAAPGDSQNSGNIINSNVNLNLSTAESSWTGRAYQSYRIQNEDGSYTSIENVELNAVPFTGNVTDFKLTMSNGAQWNLTGSSFMNDAVVSSGSAIHVNPSAEEEAGVVFNATSITLDNGTLDVADTKSTVNINKISGAGDVLLAVGEDENGQLVAGTFNATDASGADLAVTVTGATADDFENAESAVQFVENKVKAKGATLTKTIGEGDIAGAITEVDGIVKQAENSKIGSMTELTAISTTLWRHELNDLTKRMGELRDSPEGIGSWVRLYGSEQEYGSTTLKNTSVQVGADYSVGDWVVGGAFSYTDGTADYANGEGDAKAYGFAVYGALTAENGMFLDLIAKYSRLENDFDIGNMSGELDNNAYSVSAEFGWRFDLNHYAYIEPQAELTYGRIVGDDVTTSNDVRIDQDDTDSFLGRIGLRAGLKFPENKGSLYARLSGVYDFDGETSATFSNGKKVERYSEDLGGGWVEYAVGANLNLTPSTYTYLDLERTSGGEVKEKWRWNIGVRHVF